MNLDVTQYPCLRMPTVAPEDMTEEDKIKLAAIALVQQTFMMNQDDMTSVPTNDELEDSLAKAMIVVRESRETAAEEAAKADMTNSLIFMPLDRPEPPEPLEEPVRDVDDQNDMDDVPINAGPAHQMTSDFFHTPYTWDEMCEIHMLPRNTDLIGFVKAMWPSALITEITSVAMALELCPENSAVRIPWEPIKDIADFTVEGQKAKITRQVPASFGCEGGLNYFHGTSPLNGPSIRRSGLRPSPRGAGDIGPALYTCKNRKAPFHTYSDEAMLLVQKEEDGQKVDYWKPFRMLLGIGSLREYPYHDKKIQRSGGKNQFLHKPGTYQLMWVEFIATGDMVVDRTETIVNWKRHSSAMARLGVAKSLITPIAHRDLVDLGPAPEPRRRGQRYERQWHERLQTDWPDASSTAASSSGRR